MTTWRSHVGTLALAALMTSCAPLGPAGPSSQPPSQPSGPPAAGPRQLGTVAAGSVTRNGAPMAAGGPILERDDVRTAGNEATIQLFGHGSVRLSQGTDTAFQLRQDGCLVVQFIAGFLLVDGSKICVIDPSGTEAFFGSKGTVELSGQQLVVTHLEGRIQVRGAVLSQRGQQITIKGASVQAVRPLQEPELRTYLLRRLPRLTPQELAPRLAPVR